jgi:pyridoxine 5-phosphate synthase
MRVGVNIDHVATLRQQRRGRLPDPVEAGLICERAGASSIVCHLREDRRHIQDDDVRRLKRAIHTPLNLEMSIADEIVAVALNVTPSQVTLVPERRQELTTECGLDVVKLAKKLQPLIGTFHRRGITVSLFIDPLAAQVLAAEAVGARVIELHTGRFAGASAAGARRRALDALARAANVGRGLGLTVAAGHGLDDANVGPVVGIREIEEVNIGFSIITRALTVGLERAVREMVELISRGNHRDRAGTRERSAQADVLRAG